jgi:hypothetical protein
MSEPYGRNEYTYEGALDEKGQQTHTEVITISNRDLFSRVSDIIRQGNAFRIKVTDRTGKIFFDIPVGVGVVGTALFPSVAAISIVGVMVADLRIVVEKKE